MSYTPSTYRRRLGRAPSPPTWLWYEQIPFDDDSSDSDGEHSGGEFDSCSEDDEDYARVERARDVADRDRDSESSSVSDDQHPAQQPHQQRADGEGADSEKTENEKMEIDGGEDGSVDAHAAGGDGAKKDVKGKQRAVEPQVDEGPKRREHRKRHREPVITLRPILTIQKSQGFVWNQDLFVPPYIKDRLSDRLISLCSHDVVDCPPADVASTSPPNGSGFLSTPASSFNSINDYEVDVVEIRVKEGEYADIIP
ncbi:hypothetical protein DFH11DRAFT_883356 [Phellopilus nigrolimitatus]|nr:hypothetical protein DFH11DRAFT_883356 [Phellopilus nigrolimitatus]